MNFPPATLLLTLLGVLLPCQQKEVAAFVSSSSSYPSSLRTSSSLLRMAAGGGKNKGKKIVEKISLKGFGSTIVKKGDSGELLRDSRTEDLFLWLSQKGADLKRIALADFGGLRGVMALQDIAKGQNIIEIPSQLALDLGEEGSDPTRPALELLKVWSEGPSSRWWPYLESLPQPGCPDLSTTDFFTNDELEMLQWPPLVEETKRRIGTCESLYTNVIKTQMEMGTFHSSSISLDDLKWATFIVVSRVLTVQRKDGVSAAKLLIPGIDMFNHDASSPHILTGIAAPGRTLKIVAAKNIKAGSQVTIAYSGGRPRSDRFLSDYGESMWHPFFLPLRPALLRK